MKNRSPIEKEELNRHRRLLEQQIFQEIAVNPGYQTHEDLWQVTQELPSDFEPYGQRKRDVIGDCSCGCRWFHILAGRRGKDWGVCTNTTSPRAGLLTFEHQGCPKFESDSRFDYLETAQGRKARRQFEKMEAERKISTFPNDRTK